MKVKNILILGYKHIGDTLFLTPAIRAIKENFPSSYVAVITGKASEEILKDNPYVDDIIPLPNNSFKDKLKIKNILKNKRFDTGFLFQHTFLNALFLCYLGIKNRIGLSWKGCGFLLTHKIKYNPNWHEVERYLNIVNMINKNHVFYKPEIFLKQEDELYADFFLKKNRITSNDLVICVNPGSSEKWKIKRWAIENYAELIDYLIEKLSAKVFVLSGIFEDKLIDTLHNLTRNKFIVIKEKSLKKLAAIIKRSNLFITNDTGPMHLACAVGVKVIDIVGPSNVKKTGPLSEKSIIIKKNVSCSPCKKISCDDLRCLKQITTKDVIDVVEGELSK